MFEKSVPRRAFLKNLLSLGASFAGLQILTRDLAAAQKFQPDLDLDKAALLSAQAAEAAEAAALQKFLCEGYGDLVADKNKLLNLPKGFAYKVIARAGDKLSDGFLSAGRPDGMCAFAGSNGNVVVIRNHELSSHQVEHSPFGEANGLLKKAPKSHFFDYGRGKFPHVGGCSTLVYDEKRGVVVKSFLSLLGTSRNCAGGAVGGRFWLSCEEDFQPANEKNEQEHGFAFLVPVSEQPKSHPAKVVKAMGRFNHEAAAQDVRSGVVYLTEDRHEGLLYRYVPVDKHALEKGGRLEALAFTFKRQMDTRNWTTQNLKPNLPYSVYWLPLTDVCPKNDNLRVRGFKAGAACFARGEGIWAGEKSIFFACTNGGKLKSGQIFKYTPSPYEGTKKERNAEYRAKLELFCEPNNHKLLRYADNLTVAPNGDLVFVEDNSRPRIVGITPKGKFYVIAENVGHQSEMAGVCFSPSGKTLFVNIQEAGLTLAITGNWAARKS